MQLKEHINALKSKLYTEIKNYENIKQELESLVVKKDVLNEIINYLKNTSTEEMTKNSFQLGLSLPIVYGEVEANNIYDKILSCIYSNDQENSNKKIELLKTKFNSDLEYFSNQHELLKNQISIKTTTIIEYRRILSNFKYYGLITSLQIDLLTKFMQQYQYSPKDQIIILESIRIHNIRVKHEDKSKISYTVFNMLEEKYEKYDIDELERIEYKDKFKPLIDSFNTSIKMCSNVEDVIELMPELESDNYTFEEFCYIYKNVLNYLINELNESINSISDPEIYKDIELRKVVLQEYNECKYKYSKIQYLYNNQRQKYLYKLKQEKESEVVDNATPVNNIFYQLLSNGETTYLEKDIKDFPEEYLSKVKKLIEDKKYDRLAPDMDKSFKAIHKQMKEYRELRWDQVRIVYKHLSENNYLIVGAFVKKDNNDRNTYGNIASRYNSIDISTSQLLEKELQNSSIVESRLFNYIDENRRKGSR